eukprot:6468499-Amphidinium_carterae.5
MPTTSETWYKDCTDGAMISLRCMCAQVQAAWRQFCARRTCRCMGVRVSSSQICWARSKGYHVGPLCRCMPAEGRRTMDMVAHPRSTEGRPPPRKVGDCGLAMSRSGAQGKAYW